MNCGFKVLAADRAEGYLELVVENDFQLRNHRAMIVCLCKGVSSRTILDEVRRGNCSVKGIAQACAAGRGCGSCVGQIRELIQSTGAVARSHDQGSNPGR
ncbi:MAG: (2Fe-2S)-binding protein [Nannocystaceae bacterium]